MLEPGKGNNCMIYDYQNYDLDNENIWIIFAQKNNILLKGDGEGLANGSTNDMERSTSRSFYSQSFEVLSKKM